MVLAFLLAVTDSAADVACKIKIFEAYLTPFLLQR